MIGIHSHIRSGLPDLKRKQERCQEGQKPENAEGLVSVDRDVPERVEFERLFITSRQGMIRKLK
jgi:hypothetical protein